MPTINHNFDVTIDINDLMNRCNRSNDTSGRDPRNDNATTRKTEHATIRINGTCSTTMSMDMMPAISALLCDLVGAVASAKKLNRQ